ncbi:MAG TPA: hypothetical protein VL486_06010 [Verrucomicrobiae bacterium]|nr:hypothetical protein [Verrucomicrobiae bacterium]
MNRQVVFGAFLAIAPLFMSVTSQARWMNPNTGRFQTADSYEGDQEDPPSLHRYVYAVDDPVNGIDPSGNFCDINSISIAQTESAYLDAISAGASQVAKRQAVYQISKAIGTALAPLLAATIGAVDPTDQGGPASVAVFREIDAQKGNEIVGWRKPDTGRSAFGWGKEGKFPGTSAWEYQSLPGSKPYVVGFVVNYYEPKKAGGLTKGPVQGIPACVATWTPEDGGGKDHWSLVCGPEDATKTALSFYARNTPSVVQRNFVYKVNHWNVPVAEP